MIIYQLESAMETAQEEKRRQQKNDKSLFPSLLHDLLDDVESLNEADIVCWRPSGACFKVHKRDEFMTKVLPRYFRQTHYKSFVRQLNIWGFACVTQGPDKGSCKCTTGGARVLHKILPRLASNLILHLRLSSRLYPRQERAL